MPTKDTTVYQLSSSKTVGSCQKMQENRSTRKALNREPKQSEDMHGQAQHGKTPL